MTTAAKAELPGLNLLARDVSGQRRVQLRSLRPDWTVRELLAAAIPSMKLGARPGENAPHAFHAFLTREGKHLRSSDLVGDVLRDGDEIRIDPDIQAGRA